MQNNYVTFTTEESRQAEDFGKHLEPTTNKVKSTPSRNNSFICKNPDIVAKFP
jgi:hypothetical protein